MKTNIRKILSLLLVIAMLLFTAASFTGSAEPLEPNVDTDGDGIVDDDEDENDDNMTNGDDNNNNIMDEGEDWTETSPNNPDSDDDGIIDSKDDNPLEKDKLEQYTDDAWDRNEVSKSLINIFLFVLLLSFAIFSLLAGIFTAYFGAGKSRAIGGGLLVLGLVIILVWVYYGILGSYPDDTLLGVVHWDAAKTLEAFITVLSAIIGAVIAVVMFLVAIMKS